ncbi:hypothetical protein PR202_gb28375 [Eleusine coracana subsp. coracana]|uniref:HMA domain-containing protein n=1 Tax=Eleusine coracana subsp. coracana TaxID=191504 RepID=A0AAV5FU97_ELECO|nr:hypothetical protein PR202_gb28375 [Eleusine coracana subsp. coracana]
MGDAAAAAAPAKYQKSYFDVLGICCTTEVPVIEKLLSPLPGVHKVSVIVPSRTVIVVHDADAISPAQIVKVLNQAKFEASVRAYGSGTGKITNKWPSPYVMICGVFLSVSLFEHFWHPLKWFALVAAAAGLPPIILKSIAAARRLSLDINILMLIAVSGAIALGDYSEAGFIVFLFSTAEWLNTRASRKATDGMSSLLSMTPQKAVLAETGEEVAVQDVKVDTVIAVKAGDVIPIDGVVVDGRGEVDESTLTGESFPVAKQPESQVWAGTLNIDGYIAVRTTAMADNSAVAKMARLVEEAQNSRSSTQRLIDTCAKYYTPAIVVMAFGSSSNSCYSQSTPPQTLVPIGPCPSRQRLPMVSSIESRSSHPMAPVLVDYAQSNSVEPKSENVTAFEMYPGEGIYGEIDGEGVYIGNKRILSRASCETAPSFAAVPDAKDMKGVTIGYIACKKELIGIFTLSDSCRIGSAEAIRELRSLGIKSVMLTGDSAAAAAYAQNQLGNALEEVHSELRPADKVRIVDELKARYGPTLMIGDGINDAPALAKADVGVSMGVSGSAVAMETSHITLMSNDIRRIPKAVHLARRTHRTIIVNIIFSVITKLAIVGLALAGHPHIWAAVLADVGTCLLVIMYSMLLLRDKGGRKAKKHCVSRHCSDGPCKSTGSCKESSAGKHGCHDHGHSHKHCKEPSRQQLTEKHGCHDHGHSHSHCKEPNNLLLTDNHVSHDHGHRHNHCQEPNIARFTDKSECHDHEHSHCKESDTSHSISKGARHAHEHGQCEEHKHSHFSGEHEHSHCKEQVISCSSGDHVCHDHDLEPEHHCHAEHTADTYHCHDHDHDHAEIEETEKDCQAELQHHHSHCCHEPHVEHNSAADSVQQHSISIDATSEIQDQHSHCGHLNEEHKDEGCENHLKAKDCAPSQANGVGKNCCNVTMNKGCGSKSEDICSSLQQVFCVRETSRCCRSYVKCHRTSSCCSHSILKLPEIVVE